MTGASIFSGARRTARKPGFIQEAPIRRLLIAVGLGLALLVAYLVTSQSPISSPFGPDQAWTEVRTWTGDSFLRTEPFEVSSREWRARWKTQTSKQDDPAAGEQDGSNYFAAWAYSPDRNTVELVVSVANQPSGEGSRTFVAGPGRFYLEISTVDLDWTVVVEDRR